MTTPRPRVIVSPMTHGPSYAADARRLADALEPARRILVFSGAGLSTASGIPDFRGPAGIWKRLRPVDYSEFLASGSARHEYWTNKLAVHDAFQAARPNAAHRAIVDLERRGRLRAVVTQNIDGLHQAAGTSEALVVEVHGTNRFVECVSCGAITDPQHAVASFRESGEVPACPCGGWLKFATISFGQPLRDDVLQRAALHASACDLVLALGSTLSVHPASTIPLVAVRRGSPYVILNQGATEHDEMATLRLEGDVSILLPAAVALLGD
jgi:NAD-dependent deacetylase